jgi:hypothetical protein
VAARYYSSHQEAATCLTPGGGTTTELPRVDIAQWFAVLAQAFTSQPDTDTGGAIRDEVGEFAAVYPDHAAIAPANASDQDRGGQPEKSLLSNRERPNQYGSNISQSQLFR